MLCNRPLNTEKFDIKSWEKARRDIEQLIREADQLLQFYDERAQVLRNSIVEISVRVKWLEGELQRETDNYVSPLVEEVRLIASEKGELEKLLDQLRYQESQRDYADRYEVEFIPSIERELEDLKDKITILQQDLGYTSDRYNAFVFSEQAEQQADQEVRGAVGVFLPAAQQIS